MNLLFLSDSNAETWMLYVFGGIILLFLLVDLGLLQRKAHKVTFKSALIQSIFWIVISLGFSVLVYYYDGKDNFYDYLNAYVTEYALSVDNIFLFIMILRHFKVPEKLHHKVLYYGVFGAMIFRAIFIGLGKAIIEKWEWVLWIFGAILIYTGAKMLFSKKEEDFEPEKNRVYRFIKKNFRIHPDVSTGKFTIIEQGKRYFTTLAVVILLVETTDIIFALDSIPAVFGITTNPFIIYTSNIFAVMGLRSMFFMLEGIIDKFYMLQKGISFILLFIGAKMLMDMVGEFMGTSYHIPSGISFSIIIVVLAGSIIISLVNPKKEKDSNIGQDIDNT